MRFQQFFKRQKGAVSSDPLIGSDATPVTGAPNATQDNMLACHIRDVNGWPVQRIAVCWFADRGTPVALNGDLYFYETTQNRWYKINDVPLSLKPNQLFFFDTITVSEPRPTRKTIDGSIPGSSSVAGQMNVQLVITDPGTAINAVYTFSIAPDLTTVGT